MTIEEARNTIIRKFTNYRNKVERNAKKVSTNDDIIEAMKSAAYALIDLRTVSNGKNLFRRKHHEMIISRRDTLMKEDPSLPQVAAYQKALNSYGTSKIMRFGMRRL